MFVSTKSKSVFRRCLSLFLKSSSLLKKVALKIEFLLRGDYIIYVTGKGQVLRIRKLIIKEK